MLVSQNNKIIEWFAQKGALEDPVMVAGCGQGHQQLDQIAQNPIQLGLEQHQGYNIHDFSGHPVPVLYCKEFLPDI